MSRDHRKLRAFEIADALVTHIYRHTKDFPRDQWYGIRAQIRRAAVSVPSNLVEGSARKDTKDYCNFCNIACGSAFEMRYLTTLSGRLGLLSETVVKDLAPRLDMLCATLVKLVDALELEAAREAPPPRRKQAAQDPNLQA